MIIINSDYTNDFITAGLDDAMFDIDGIIISDEQGNLAAVLEDDRSATLADLQNNREQLAAELSQMDHRLATAQWATDALAALLAAERNKECDATNVSGY